MTRHYAGGMDAVLILVVFFVAGPLFYTLAYYMESRGR